MFLLCEKDEYENYMRAFKFIVVLPMGVYFSTGTGNSGKG